MPSSESVTDTPVTVSKRSSTTSSEPGGMSKRARGAVVPATGVSCQERSGSVSLGVQILTWASAASSRPVSRVMRRSVAGKRPAARARDGQRREAPEWCRARRRGRGTGIARASWLSFGLSCKRLRRVARHDDRPIECRLPDASRATRVISRVGPDLRSVRPPGVRAPGGHLLVSVGSASTAAIAKGGQNENRLISTLATITPTNSVVNSFLRAGVTWD